MKAQRDLENAVPQNSGINCHNGLAKQKTQNSELSETFINLKLTKKSLSWVTNMVRILVSPWWEMNIKSLGYRKYQVRNFFVEQHDHYQRYAWILGDWLHSGTSPISVYASVPVYDFSGKRLQLSPHSLSRAFPASPILEIAYGPIFSPRRGSMAAPVFTISVWMPLVNRVLGLLSRISRFWLRISNFCDRF